MTVRKVMMETVYPFIPQILAAPRKGIAAKQQTSTSTVARRQMQNQPGKAEKRQITTKIY